MMRKYPGMPELLEHYMQEQGTDEQWVTVQELRDRFGLTRYQCNTVSGFLRRLEFGSFRSFPYIVMRIEQTEPSVPSDPPRCRYRVCRKDLPVPVPRGTPGRAVRATGSASPAEESPASSSI